MPSSLSSYAEAGRLAQAAISIHRLLSRKKLAHCFLGDYELTLLGLGSRAKHIEVAVKKPICKGYRRVKEALLSDGTFAVFDQSRADFVNAIQCVYMPSGVNIDIQIRFVQRAVPIVSFLNSVHFPIQRRQTPWNSVYTASR